MRYFIGTSGDRFKECKGGFYLGKPPEKTTLSRCAQCVSNFPLFGHSSVVSNDWPGNFAGPVIFGRFGTMMLGPENFFHHLSIRPPTIRQGYGGPKRVLPMSPFSRR